RDIQGDVIDFVRLVKGISFKEALAFLSEEPFQKEAIQEKRERPFYYPLKRVEDSNCSLTRYYLTECRGISEEIIQKMIQQGLIAQASWKTN
ncbi:DNA primase, partial [Streptococcus sp. KR]